MSKSILKLLSLIASLTPLGPFTPPTPFMDYGRDTSTWLQKFPICHFNRREKSFPVLSKSSQSLHSFEITQLFMQLSTRARLRTPNQRILDHFAAKSQASWPLGRNLREWLYDGIMKPLNTVLSRGSGEVRRTGDITVSRKR